MSEPFTKDEFILVKSKLVDVIGSDGIAPDAYKYWDFDNILLEHENNILLEKQRPTQCQIITISKPGNLNHIANYRVIAFSAYST